MHSIEQRLYKQKKKKLIKKLFSSQEEENHKKKSKNQYKHLTYLTLILKSLDLSLYSMRYVNLIGLGL